MSDEQSGLIAYGFDLGGPVIGWKVWEADAASLTTDWAEDAEPDDELWDFIPSVSHLNVEVEQYGDYEDPCWLLAAYYSHTGSSHELLDVPSLQEQHDYTAWDTALRRALTEIGLTPHQQRPSWLLGSFYG